MPGKGPSPLPSAVLRLRGSTVLRKRAGEPKPATGRLTCPAELKGEARNEWNRTIVPWSELGVVAKINRAVAAAYCQAWADTLEAQRNIDLEGAVFVTPRGFKEKNPWVTIKNEASLRLLRFAQELGLTPAAQTRVRVKVESKTESKLRFFGEVG